MLRFALLLPALALLALGVYGLYEADRESQTDFIIAGVELVAGMALIGLAFILGRRGAPEPVAPAIDSAARAEVIERLQRHTEALRHAESGETTPSPDAGLRPVSDAPGLDRDDSARIGIGGMSPAVIPPDDMGLASESPVDGAAEQNEAVAGDTGGAPAAPAAVRLPSMMLLNMSDTASPADIESAPPLGSRDEVLGRLREIVPDLEVDANGRSEHTGPDHSVRLDLGPGDVVHTIVIEAAGGTGISMVRWVLESTGWRAFVPRSGRFIEPDALEGVAMRNGG